MGLTREEVRRIAALARLRLEPGEEERLAGELSAILDYVRQLEELDVAGVEPMTHALAAGETPFREDAVLPGLPPGATMWRGRSSLNSSTPPPCCMTTWWMGRGSVGADQRPTPYLAMPQASSLAISCIHVLSR